MMPPTIDPPVVASLSHVHTTTQPGQPALHDVSFKIQRGEVLTLLNTGAASGGGTALALFAGFARATIGEVAVGGRITDATPTHRRPIGMVTQGLSLFPHLDVAGHAGFAPGSTTAQADALLDRLGLKSFARRRPATLSPELRFRTALARALSSAPRLLLLEDPFSTMSAAASLPLKALLRAIAAETGVAILHAADDVVSSFGLCDRVGVMQAGALRQIGTPQGLYDQPRTLAVAAAMGPLNRLAGTVLDQEDDIARIRLSGGAIVEARTEAPLAPGVACVVALRPERIAVAAASVGEIGDGAVSAKLVETVFAGNHKRLRFSLDTSTEAAAEILVTRPSGAIVPPGPAMNLAWQPHHAHAFRTEIA